MPSGDLQSHLSDDDILLAALGETLDDGARVHIDSCLVCRMEVDDMSRVVDLGRDSRSDPPGVAPPASVWRGINERLSSGDQAGSASVVGFPTRRSRSRGWPMFPLLAAAVVGLIVGAGLVAAVGAWQTEPTVLAAAALGPVQDGPAGPQTGYAEVAVVDGAEVLLVTTNDLADPQGFYEVWLLNLDTGGMIAVGAVPAGSHQTMLPIPAGVDLTDFSAVDISEEPLDGDPTHSSVSVLRGDLTA